MQIMAAESHSPPAYSSERTESVDANKERVDFASSLRAGKEKTDMYAKDVFCSFGKSGSMFVKFRNEWTM